MYKVLIVDDEKIEREGIKLLIKKYKLELEVAEAENGRAALEYIKSNPVDILLTDIKMPFMDGLELAENAKKLDQNLKIIIYSAFGEFDYARKAIHIKVEHYILKPINKQEFFRVMTQALEDCTREKEETLRSEKIMELYQKGVQHEKEKVLLDIVNGARMDADFQKRMEMAELRVAGKFVRMMLVDFKSRFYDTYDKNFKTLLKENILFDHEYLNLNERQSLVFILPDSRLSERETFKELGNQILEEVSKRYGLKTTIVFSDILDDFTQIEQEMNKMEQVLDCKFFYDESLVLFTCMEDSKENAATSVEIITDKIYKSIDTVKPGMLENEINGFFDHLKGKSSFSAIYVKYICAEIVKKIYRRAGKSSDTECKTAIEGIFKSETLEQLRDIMHKAAGEPGRTGKEDKKHNTKGIRDVLAFVEGHYMEDISVEWIADRVYLTPNYLNLIFKKETGQSLGKYITCYRLKKAEELLQETNMKIIDIGQAVGYTNNSYFCLLFKNYYGMTPMQYREMEK